MVGNLPNYSTYDVLRAFLLINKESSRKQLTKTLDIGEGTIRSILDILKNKGLITSSPRGHAPTHQGNVLLQKIKKKIEFKEVKIISPFPKYKKTALHIKNCLKNKKSFELRDKAVKNGAEGCVIFEMRNGFKLYGEEKAHGYENLEVFPLKEHDILIFTYSPSKRWSEISALAAAEDIIDEIREFFKIIS